MELKSGVYGRYRLTVRRDDEVIEQTPWFDNLIVNNGLDLLGTNIFNDCIVYAYVGTDSTAPANTDTALGAQIASTNTSGPGNTNTSNTASSPYYFGYKYVKRFAKGEAAGNLTEVGVGTNGAGSDLFSHALILDGVGSPTTLTITSIDVLDVEYEFRVYVEESDVPWFDTVNGTNYSGVILPSFIQAINDLDKVYISSVQSRVYEGTVGGIESVPNGVSTIVTGFVEQAYVNGNYYRDSALSIPTSSGNLSLGIGALVVHQNVVWSQCPIFQMSFNPNVPKDNTKTFDISMRSTWARYTPV